MADQYRRFVRSSDQWRMYFEANRIAPRPVSWHLGANLAAVERKQIAASVQEFQLGESSEGKHLLRAAEAFAVREEDSHYLPAMRLFIAEEQRHSRELGRFLDLAGIPRRRCTITDTFFRHLRRGSGLERSIVVLVTAEIIATVYYAALRDATGSSVLRTLCDLILRDEAGHVQFQCERLAILRQHRPRVLVRLGNALHGHFLWLVCVALWWRHGRVMRSGGMSWTIFRQRIRRSFARAVAYMSRQVIEAVPDEDEPLVTSALP